MKKNRFLIALLVAIGIIIPNFVFAQQSRFPHMALFANKTAYKPGDRVLLSMATAPGRENNLVDLYIAFDIPGVGFLFYPSFSPAPAPYKQSLTVTKSYETFLDLRLPEGIASLPVTVYGAYATPGTLNIIGGTRIGGPTAGIASQKITLNGDQNFIAVHDSRTTKFNGNCIDCHGDRMAIRSFEPRFVGSHTAMIPFAFPETGERSVTNNTCAYCHKTSDNFVIITDPDKTPPGATIRKHVNAEKCASCHGPTGKATKKFYLVDKQ